MVLTHTEIINSVEKTKNFFAEGLNSPVVKRVSKSYKLNPYESVLFCYTAYLNIKKNKPFKTVELSKKLDITKKLYSSYIKALNSISKKNIFVNEHYTSYNTLLTGEFFLKEIVLLELVTGENISHNLKKTVKDTWLAANAVEYVFLGNRNALSERKNELFATYHELELLKAALDRYVKPVKPINRVKALFEFFSPELDYYNEMRKILEKNPTQGILIIIYFLLIKIFVEEKNAFVEISREQSLGHEKFRKLIAKFPLAKRHINYYLFMNKPESFQNLFEKKNSASVLFKDAHGGKSAYIGLKREVIRKIFGTDLTETGTLERIEPADIKHKPLFFNKDLKEETEKLNGVLSENGFEKLASVLQEEKLKPGLTVLLYGYPGTGKTEFVMQIAKKHNREVFRVNISEIRDKFVGESEKKVKEIFSTYRQILKLSPQIPILLLNEADSLISKRVGVYDSIDQMSNSMQNIFLEELESFEGILFATTNLLNNIDEAFFRRFHLKLMFSKPNRETREKIWKSKIEGLNESAYEKLAEFILSGGEIDNVLRRFLIARILNNNLNKEEILIAEAEKEAEFKSERTQSKTLGFKIG